MSVDKDKYTNPMDPMRYTPERFHVKFRWGNPSNANILRLSLRIRRIHVLGPVDVAASSDAPPTALPPYVAPGVFFWTWWQTKSWMMMMMMMIIIIIFSITIATIVIILLIIIMMMKHDDDDEYEWWYPILTRKVVKWNSILLIHCYCVPFNVFFLPGAKLWLFFKSRNCTMKSDHKHKNFKNGCYGWMKLYNEIDVQSWTKLKMF